MHEDALAGPLAPRRPDPPPWSESGAWLLWGFLSCGLLVGVGFLWIGLRYKRRDWQRWAAIYGAATVTVFAGNLVSGGWPGVMGPILWWVLVGGLIHTVAIQARHPRLAPFPLQPVVPATYIQPPVWPRPPGYAPPWPHAPAPPVGVEPWASFVRSAESARERFRQCAGRVHRGPLRDSLHELAARVDTGVVECRRIAAAGRVLATARAAIDTTVLDTALRAAAARQAAEPGDPLAASTIAALQGQRATADRMDEVIDDTVGQLRLLDARLGEAVVRVLELSAQAEAAASVPELSGDVDGLLADLEALRLAVEETHAADVLDASALPLATGPDPASDPPGGWDQPG